MVAPIGMDIVCFRYNPGNKDLTELNAINKEIKLRLEEQAIAVPGYTTLNEVYCLRMAISSHRCTYEDIEEVIKHIIRIGNELIK
jgi:glutamate/tyrosine decarboxylase-like PLP-dependent enzyme